MRFLFLMLAVGLLLTIPSLSDAAIYKWVDKNGTVHFTDSPPPSGSNAKEINPEPNRLEGYGKVPENRPAPRGRALPQATKIAHADLPIVELFVTSWCGYCKKAEAYFKKRKIPFVKYDIEKDRQAARRKASLTQSRGVPFVLIGEVGIPGYSEEAFDRALRQYQ